MGKSKSEVGNAKNVTNFDAAIDILDGMGTDFNPGNEAITISSLKATNTKLQYINEEYKTNVPLFKLAIAERVAIYKPMNVLGTRMVNAFKSFGMEEGKVEPMVSLNKKLRGERIVKIKEDKPEEEETETISTAQTSYDNKADTLDSMIKYAEANPIYKPNEVELQPTELRKYHEKVMLANKKASVTMVQIIVGRKRRNEILYDNPENVIELMRMVKSYLKSLDGAKEYYDAIVKLKFRDKNRS